MAQQLPQTLKEELEKDIEHHSKWSRRDFAWAQIFIWVGIVASIAASLNAAKAFELCKLYGAILAAIPGAVLVVDRTFKFASRASWHSLYVAYLKALHRRIRDQGEQEGKVSPDKSKLDVEMEKMFPPLDAAGIGAKKP
jgi:hypothetical protein